MTAITQGRVCALPPHSPQLLVNARRVLGLLQRKTLGKGRIWRSFQF